MKFFCIFLAVCMLCGLLSVGMAKGQEAMKDAFNVQIHEELETVKENNGKKVITYLIEEDYYSQKYLPKEIAATKAEEIGYVLRLSVYYGQAFYQGGVIREIENISAELVKYPTGRVIASESFIAKAPVRTSGAGRDWVEEAAVRDWVAEKMKGR